MSTPAIIMWAVVLAVGLPSTRWNPTAGALSIAWLLGEITWMVTGNSFPLTVYFMADVAVIVVIYAKTIHRCGAKFYSSLGEQLRCLVTDLTPWDRLVVAIYVLGAWPLYILALHPYSKWWLLWTLAIAQFVFAGIEALSSFRETRKETRPTPIIDRHLVVIPFPVRRAEAVRKAPEHSGTRSLQVAEGGYG